MKRKGFLKSLATFIAAPSLIEGIGEEDKSVIYKENIEWNFVENLGKPPQWAKSFCYVGETKYGVVYFNQDNQPSGVHQFLLTHPKCKS